VAKMYDEDEEHEMVVSLNPDSLMKFQMARILLRSMRKDHAKATNSEVLNWIMEGFPIHELWSQHYGEKQASDEAPQITATVQNVRAKKAAST
jgi:hypothetical protein